MAHRVRTAATVVLMYLAAKVYPRFDGSYQNRVLVVGNRMVKLEVIDVSQMANAAGTKQSRTSV